VASALLLLPVTLLAQVSVSPTTLNWVSVPVGGRGAQKVVTLTNGGTASITIASIGLTGTNSGDFAIWSKTCGSSLAASSSCSANIVFAPTATGARSAKLSFTDSASGSPQTMTLTGTGTSSSGTVSASPTSLTFASTKIGSSSASQAVTLSNSLSSSITISSVTISGTNAGDFGIASKTCSTSLAAAGSCLASIVFKPTATGARTATLSFTDSATNSPQLVILNGTGAATGSGSASVSPTTLNWVAVPVGGRGAQKVITLTNSGTSSLAISSLTLTGTNPGDFAIFSKTCGTSLAASATCTANIVFAPTTTGERYATLNFNDSASNSPQTVALSGNGTGASGTVTASPSSVTFASTTVGSSTAAQTVTLSNGLTSSLTISGVAISGTNAGDFSIASKTCGTSLAASANCTASIIFKPTAAGTRTATLSFTDSATNSPQKVSLSGSGSTTTLTISPLNPTVTVNGTVQFTASASSTWTATCGTIGSSSGLYTAPTTVQSCTVKATATSGGATASTTVTVTASTGNVTITPASVALHAIGQTQFTANTSVTWSTTCGSITSAGLFTAPAANTNCTIKATSTTNSSNTGTATASVTVVNYTTRKNGTDGTGVQANELVLTPASVASGKFVQLWSAGLDGPIWGQPLYMNGLTVGGKTRNVVYVTTSNDSVYALDADTGALLWKKSFLSTGVTAVPTTATKISTVTGILSTPVIDPVKQAIFVVAETSENNATYFPHRLHALSLITGSELTADPELISDADLQPIMKFQRPGLLLANGMIYVGFGSIEDRSPYHGLLFAFDENTLEQKAVFNVAPNGQGGLWMSGASPEADSKGNIYLSTGNGAVGTNNFGESIVKLSPTLQELDYFTPYNYASYDTNDLDMGSGSMILVPDQNGSYPHLIIACGKPTPIYVINRDAFGGRGTTSDNIVQRLDHQIGGSGSVRDSGQPCYNSPAMWQQNVYFAANYDVMKMFTLDANTGMLSATPTSKGTFTYNWPGADPVISSKGNTNGIVWTIDVSTSTLHANDATDVSKSLYTSASLGSAGRWVPPTVVNGHVYVTASGKIIAYGLKP
jgi:Abnormal spindle-like microcephaly-assoc'd, ASPM-SPD-2-Hydin/PQQ-like domain